MVTEALTLPPRLPNHRPEQPLRARGANRLLGWVLLAAIGGFAALALPMLLGQVYVADDLGEFHLPLRAFYARQLQDGQPFDWMSSLYGGFYLTGEGQVGVYHPLHVLLYRTLSLGLAFDLELLLSYPLMFAGTYWFLARLLGQRAPAAFGALAFTFSGFNLLHFVHPNAVAIVAHLPWLLLCVDVALRSANRRSVVLAEASVALLVASQLLLGYPQYVWFSLLAVAAYAVCVVIGSRPAAGRVAGLGWSLLVGGLCAGVQLAPTYDLLSNSARHAADAGFANSGSLHPLNLMQLVAPYALVTRVVGQNTHELGLYVGAVPLALCVWLAAHRSRWGVWKPLVVAVAICGGLALLLALGQFGGLYRLQSFLPLVSRFRFPCRAIVLVQWCVAIASAISLAILFDMQRNVAALATQRPVPRSRALIAMMLASIVTAVVAPLVWPEFCASAWRILAGPLLIASAIALVWLVERGVRWAPATLVLFTIVDLSVYGLSYSVYGRTADLQQFVARSPHPPEPGAYRIAAAPTSDGLRAGNRVLLAGSTRVDGYAGLEPAKRLDYQTASALRLAGTQWAWRPTLAKANSPAAWSPVEVPAPRVRLISKTAPPAALRDLATLHLDAAVVEPEVKLDTTATGSATLAVDRDGLLVVDVQSDGQQLLATTESFHSGWQATADGRDVPVVRVNGDFLGCVLGPDAARVALEFRPASLRVGKILSWCGLGLWVCTLAVRLPLGRSRNCRDRLS